MRHQAILKISLVLGLVGLGLALATNAVACVFGPPLNPRDEVIWNFQEAETVFVGRLLTDTVDAADSLHRHTVTFEVSTSWKGKPVSPFTLHANESDTLPEGDCPNLAQDLRVGELYIVFAFESSSNNPSLFTNSLYSPLLDSADGHFAMSVLAQSHLIPRFIGMPTAGEEWNIALPAAVAFTLFVAGVVVRYHTN